MTTINKEAYGKQLIECANRNNLDINNISNVANVLYKEQSDFGKLAESESGIEIIKFLGA